MPEPKIRFYLHGAVAASSGHRPVFLSVGVGAARPVRQAAGYAAHPAYFNAPAPPRLQGADSQRTITEQRDELRLAVQKACRRLADEGPLRRAALAPLVQAALAGRQRGASR